MIIDSRLIENSTSIECSICVIGAGVSGITIATELQKQGIDVCILESGGYSPDQATNNLYEGESVGLPYNFSDGYRTRCFGGSSNCWHGWCAPLDDMDFIARNWVNNSGWPFGKEELTVYYKRAHTVLKLGPYNYDPSYWEKAINHPEVKRVICGDTTVITKISQFSPPIRMGKEYKNDLKERNVRVFLYANVTDIDCNESGTHVTKIKVKTLRGNCFYVCARQFILSAGAIENARLLLSADTVHKKGLGNSNDLVGRYFMDHPRLSTGNIVFAKPWASNRFYDMKYHDHSPVVSAFGKSVAAQFSLLSSVQQKNRLLNARVSFNSVFYGEDSRAGNALRGFKQAIINGRRRNFPVAKEFLELIKDPINAASFSASRVFKSRSLVKSVQFQIITEQQPDAKSRVTLSNEEDPLGMRRVKVNWCIGEMGQYTINRTLSIIADHLQRSGTIKKINFDNDLPCNDWPGKVEGTWHHMGTTRMHNSPNKGVVDKDCKVHGVENLYIAGSSVFPTSGANFPTITLTALALRLADHISKRMTTGVQKIPNLSPLL